MYPTITALGIVTVPPSSPLRGLGDIVRDVSSARTLQGGEGWAEVAPSLPVWGWRSAAMWVVCLCLYLARAIAVL